MQSSTRVVQAYGELTSGAEPHCRAKTRKSRQGASELWWGSPARAELRLLLDRHDRELDAPIQLPALRRRVACDGAVLRVLIEAAWNYRFPPRITRPLQKRQELQPSAVRAIAWQAQLRINHRYRQLTARGLQHNKICVAIARELAGFLWSIGQQVTVRA